MTREEQIKHEIELDLESRIEKLWLYVRKKRHSLDADLVRKSIAEAMNLATASVVKTLSPLVRIIDAGEAKLKATKEMLKAKNREIDELKKEVSELRDKAVEVH